VVAQAANSVLSHEVTRGVLTVNDLSAASLSKKRVVASPPSAAHPASEADSDFVAVDFVSDQPFRLAAFQDFLSTKLPKGECGHTAKVQCLCAS